MSWERLPRTTGGNDFSVLDLKGRLKDGRLGRHRQSAADAADAGEAAEIDVSSAIGPKSGGDGVLSVVPRAVAERHPANYLLCAIRFRYRE